MTSQGRWNHNIHYHPLVLSALPADCGHVLDVGCGEGTLARELSASARRVTAIDRDPPSIELARRQPAPANVEYVLGDFLCHEFEPASFDAVVSVAALHHMGTAAGLARMRACSGRAARSRWSGSPGPGRLPTCRTRWPER